jgi:hypothetical protein
MRWWIPGRMSTSPPPPKNNIVTAPRAMVPPSDELKPATSNPMPTSVSTPAQARALRSTGRRASDVDPALAGELSPGRYGQGINDDGYRLDQFVTGRSAPGQPDLRVLTGNLGHPGDGLQGQGHGLLEAGGQRAGADEIGHGHDDLPRVVRREYGLDRRQLRVGSGPRPLFLQFLVGRRLHTHHICHQAAFPSPLRPITA